MHDTIIVFIGQQIKEKEKDKNFFFFFLFISILPIYILMNVVFDQFYISQMKLENNYILKRRRKEKKKLHRTRIRLIYEKIKSILFFIQIKERRH